MQEGQDFDNDSVQQPEFSSSSIGDKATPEYFSRVEGGKKNKDKVTAKRTRFTRKTLFIILGAIFALALIFVIVFVILNLHSHNIGKRTNEDLPTTISEIQLRTYKAANNTGKYYDGILYLRNLILDLEDSEVDADFIVQAKVFLAQLIYEAGSADIAIRFLNNLEAQETVTDTQKYWLYSGLIDIYNQEGNSEEVAKYQDLARQLNVDYNYLNLSKSLGGGSNEN